MRALKLSIVAVPILLLCAVTSGCFVRQMAVAYIPTVININKDCQILDEDGNPLPMPFLVYSGANIVWKNNSYRGVSIVVDADRFLTRGESFFLAPGENLRTRVRSGLADGKYMFTVTCQDTGGDEAEDDTSDGSSIFDEGKKPSPKVCDPNDPRYDPNVCP